MGVKNILIVGCGGAGFWSAVALQTLKHNLHVVDFDRVELRNTNRLPLEPGEYKVEGLKKFIHACELHTYCCEVSPSLISLINPEFIIDCTDDIEVQKMLYNESVKRHIGYVKAGSYQNRATTSDVNPEYVWDMFPDDNSGTCTEENFQWLQTQLILAGLVVDFVQRRTTKSIELDKEE